MGEAEGSGGQRRSRKKIGRAGKEKTKRGKNSRSKEGSRGMGNLG